MTTAVKGAAPARIFADVNLHQRGRSELEFIRSVGPALAPVRARILDKIRQSGKLKVGSSDIVALRNEVDPVVRDTEEIALTGAFGNWLRSQTTPRAIAAFEAQRDELEPLAVPPDPDAIVHNVDEADIPRYWKYNYHGTPGGWDGYEHMGFIHYELVYRYLVAPMYSVNGDIFAQRTQVADLAPKDTYKRILDLGAGPGQYTTKLTERYPGAEITALDLSIAELNYAQRRAAEHGWNWKFVRAAAERTGLPSESFDLVTSFILLHEVPPPTVKAIFAEAFRLLEPGGDMVMSDVGPYANRPPLLAWQDDWLAENGNEPWWRTSATIDLTAVAESVGFVDVRQVQLTDAAYPWVTIARRPGGTSEKA